MKGRYPKYLKGAKEILDRKTAKAEKTIFEDIFYLVREGANFNYIKLYIEKKFNISFTSKQSSVKYILRLINRHCPNCIKCGQLRKHMPRKITLYCEGCYQKHQLQAKDSLRIAKRNLSVSGQHTCNKLDSIESLHGDISNSQTDMNKLGTTNISSHRFKDFKREAKCIRKELNILELK